MHEVESMAYVGLEPWHGIGHRIDNPLITPDEMLTVAGLDWEVVPHQSFIELEGKKVALDRVAHVRSTDNKILTVSGNNWKALQNRDALEFFREYTEVGGAKLETAGSLRGGKIVWGLAKLDYSFDVTSGDKVNGYLLLMSPHEVGKAITVRTTTVRVVCANTMAMAMRELGNVHRQSHIGDFDVAAAKADVGIALEQMLDAEKTAKRLSALKIDLVTATSLLSKFVQPAHDMEQDVWAQHLLNNPQDQNVVMRGIQNSMATAPGNIQGNAWGVINGVTHWVDHAAGRSSDARLFNGWVGAYSRLKLNVQDELLKLAA